MEQIEIEQLVILMLLNLQTSDTADFDSTYSTSRK